MAQRLAHKMKNPLSTMRLALQRMQTVAHQTLDEEATKFDRYIEANLNEINQLLKMTDGFMKFADLKPPHLQPTDVNTFIRGILDKYSDSLSDKIKLHVNLGSDIPPVRIDQEQIETVVENVITNALAAMETQGSINISTSFAQRFQEKFIKSGTKEYARIEISDTGRGIPCHELEKLFDPFYSQTEGGTGLGLVIVKKIIEDHKGFINVDSTEGVGTTFAFYLPVT
jgi:signal transduction histidine kinase